MKYLVISDIHCQIITLERILERTKAENLTTCLIAGDITNFGGESDLLNILALIKSYIPNIYFCLGNCDPKIKSTEIFKSYNYVESNPLVLDDFTVVGFGDQKPKINYDLLNDLKEKETPICLLSHVPPYETKADIEGFKHHCGSMELKQILIDYPIFLHICGHIHSSPAITEYASTTIINPGPVTRGNYCLISVNKHNFKVMGKIFNINKG